MFLGRFLGLGRSIVPVVAGMSDMPVLRFTVVNVLCVGLLIVVLLAL